MGLGNALGITEGQEMQVTMQNWSKMVLFVKGVLQKSWVGRDCF